MCEWGDTVKVCVPIPAHLSYTGTFRWADKPIDRCLAQIVAALNNRGIYTASCCCGHGKIEGSIVLQDGRELIVRQPS